MSTSTTNLNLVKPAGSDNVDISVINGNYDKIDQFAGNVLNGNYVEDASYVHTDNNFTNTLKNKLDGIESGANNYSLPTASTSTLGGVKVDGTTVTIDANGVISSTAQGGGGTTVVANPSGTASAALEKLQVGQDIYSTGGTTVIANPSGSGSTALEKLQVGNSVYKVKEYKELSATLYANATSVTILDSSITSNCLVRIFTNRYGISPVSVNYGSGALVISFEAMSSNLSIKVWVYDS